MRALWIAALAVALAIGILVLTLRGGDDSDAAAPTTPADDAGATVEPAPRPPADRPDLAAGQAGTDRPERGDRPPAPTVDLPDGGAAGLDDELRAWARKKRAANADRLEEARAEIRTKVTARVTDEVDRAIRTLKGQLIEARNQGDKARAQALESRLADLQANRDTLIEERVDAIVAQ